MQNGLFTEVSELKDKRILVVGLAQCGVAMAKFLVESGANVTISDHKSRAELLGPLESIEDLDVNYDLGGHSPKVFLQQDLIILSPGISKNLKIFDYAQSHGVKVTGEFEFAAGFIREPMIAVTGTNGKSTTCRLIELFLKESDVKTWIGGNYGEPLIEYVRKVHNEGFRAKVVIAEVSSFQLEHCDNFRPNSIVFMNLAENHLDRYRLMEDYVAAKRKIFQNTHSRTKSILNADDSNVVELARDPVVQKGNICYFSRKPAFEPQIMTIGGAICIKNEIRSRTRFESIDTYNVSDMKMKGLHSVENVMAAILATEDYGVTKEAIQKVIFTFPGMHHRLEYVRRVGGVEFYNDSKATNVHAVERALGAFDENVILIMGGKDTNLNYQSLKSIIRRKVKNLILVGEAKERINRDIGDESETFLIGTFEEAVLIAYQKSRIGDTVLLSPGCSSFDMFDNYEERGDYFKELTQKFR